MGRSPLLRPGIPVSTPEESPTHSSGPSVPGDGGVRPGAELREPPPSREVLERVQRRDAEALGEFFDRYFQFVFGLVHRLLGDQAAAEDAAQEIFLKIHRAVARIDPSRDPAPWLTTIAYNHCRDIWRSSTHRMQRRSTSLQESPDLGERLPGTSDTPEGEALARERESQVREAITRLPEPQREVVLLHDYRGLTHEEVAEIVGASHAAVRKRYSRALAALGQLLEEQLP